MMDISECEPPPVPVDTQDPNEKIEEEFLNVKGNKCTSQDMVSQSSGKLVLQCERDQQRKKVLLEVNNFYIVCMNSEILNL